MASKTSLHITPGKGLGFLLLGGSLHDVLVKLKSQPSVYPVIKVSYSSKEPLVAPVILSLPKNGLRLRFDGPDQRLRLIEVLDFSKIPLLYKGEPLVKSTESVETSTLFPANDTGPAFRQIYHRLFGPTFPGEYFPPSAKAGSVNGNYVLSYPGIAFSFNVEHSSWSSKADFVSILSSPKTSLAKCLTIFNGASWKEARQDYLTRPCPHPRSLALTSHSRESCPDEVELIRLKGFATLEIVRRTLPSFNITLNETNQQDLVAQLGPPDAIYRKYDRKMSIHKNRTSSRSGNPMFAGSPGGQFEGYSDTDRSSTHTNTDYSSPDEDSFTETGHMPPQECFYNYFHHGFDVFLSFPSTTTPNPSFNHATNDEGQTCANSGQLVATKVVIHGNVPGSYAFNRYRRSRWRIEALEPAITSEDDFGNISRIFQHNSEPNFPGDIQNSQLQRPMVLNRDWGESPASSFEFADFEDSRDDFDIKEGNESSLGNTHLYGFPGYLFEVLKNDAVCCLTVY